MNKIVKVFLECLSRGSGFADFDRNAQKSIRSMEKLNDNGRSLGRTFEKVGRTLGGFGGAIGTALKNIVTGGVWELAAQGVRHFIIEPWQAARKRAEEAAEAMKKAADEAVQARVKATAEEVDALAENWQKTEKAVSAVAAAENALKAAQDEYSRAVREGNAIRVDAAEKTALAALAPGDKAGAERVKAHYAQLRETMKADQTTEDAVVAYSRAGNAEGAARATLERRRGALSDAERERVTILSRIQDIADQGYLAPGNSDKGERARWEETRKRNDEEIKGLQDQLARLDKNIEALTDSVRKAETDLAVAQVRAKTADVRFQSSASNQELSQLKNAETANAAENAAWEKKRQELQQSFQNSISFLTGYSGSVRGAAAAAPAPRREDYGNFGEWNAARHEYARRSAPADRADRLARSAQGALDTLGKVDAEALVQVFDRLKAQADRLSRDIELIKQREAKK